MWKYVHITFCFPSESTHQIEGRCAPSQYQTMRTILVFLFLRRFLYLIPIVKRSIYAAFLAFCRVTF